MTFNLDLHSWTVACPQDDVHWRVELLVLFPSFQLFSLFQFFFCIPVSWWCCYAKKFAFSGTTNGLSLPVNTLRSNEECFPEWPATVSSQSLNCLIEFSSVIGFVANAGIITFGTCNTCAAYFFYSVPVLFLGLLLGGLVLVPLGGLLPSWFALLFPAELGPAPASFFIWCAILIQ